MVHSLSFSTMNLVLDSWQQLRSIADYEKVAGRLLFQKLFKECPRAKVLFGFLVEMDPCSDEMVRSRRFELHSVYLIQMLDSALNMLGPDTELLTEIMLELGHKHVSYGVTPNMFPAMGEALISTLEDLLMSKFDDKVRSAWLNVYDMLSNDMIKGGEAERRRQEKKIVVKTPNELPLQDEGSSSEFTLVSVVSVNTTISANSCSSKKKPLRSKLMKYLTNRTEDRPKIPAE